MKTTLFKTGKAASLAVIAIAVVLALTSGAAYAATIVLHPTANSATSDTWTLSAGPSKWQAVNDEAGDASTGGPSANDGVTSYVTANGILTNQAFALADNAIAGGNTITDITVTAVGRKNAAQAVVLKLYYNIGGGDVVGPTSNNVGNLIWTTVTETWSGLTWTLTDLNALEIGLTTTDSTPAIDVTQIYVTVTYVASCPDTIVDDDCTACHAYAPLDTANGDSIRNITTGAIKGDHQKTAHVPASPTDTDCNVCHTTVETFTTKHRDSNITMAAAIRGGTYSRGTTFAQSNNPTTGKCSNTQCHGIASPTWGVGSTDCSSCHPANAKSGAKLLASKHSAHVNTTTTATDRTTGNVSTSGAYVFKCGTCHDVEGQAENHLDLNSTTGIRVDVIFNLTSVSTTWTGTYAAGGVSNAQAAGSGFWYWTDRTCQNIYCHSTVQANGGVAAPTYTNPNWAAATNLGCNGCHATVPATGMHATHATSMAYACTKCHKADAGTSPKHVNGVIDMQLINGASAVYGQGNNVPRGGYSGCTNVYCHGAFNGANGTMNTPSWGNTAHGNCGTCHGATAAQTPSRTNHPRHAGAGAGQLSVLCADCHGGNPGNIGHENVRVSWNLNSATSGKLKLLAASPNPTYRAATSGTTSNAAPSPSYGTCNNIYCHSNVQADGGAAGPTTYRTPTWGATSVTCAATSCHGSATADLTTGGHEGHINATYPTYNCNLCHNNFGDETATHADKSINLAFSGPQNSAASYSQGMTHTPGAGGYGRCSSVTCHGEASPAWGSHRTATAGNAVCTTCHGVWNTASPTDAQIAPGGTGLDTGQDTAATDANVGAHQAHLAPSIGKAVTCATCHTTVSSVTQSGHIDTKLPAELTFSGLALLNSGSVTYNYVNGDCTNVYCHNQSKFKKTLTNPGWYNAIDNTPRWNNTAYFASGPGDCDMCHGYPPKPTHNVSANCSSCHPNVDANDTTFSVVANRNQHVDGVIQVQMVCDSCHGYPPRSTDSFGDINAGGRGQHWTLAAEGAHILNSALNKNGDAYPGAQCIKCHKGGTHTNDVVDVIMNTPSLNFSATGNADYIGIPGNTVQEKTCTNVMCHFTKTPKWSCP